MDIARVPYTLGGTASPGADFTGIAAGTLVFQSGISLRNLGTVTAVNDTAVESDETLIVNLGTPINAVPGPVASTMLTIKSDD